MCLISNGWGSDAKALHKETDLSVRGYENIFAFFNHMMQGIESDRSKLNYLTKIYLNSAGFHSWDGQSARTLMIESWRER